MRPPVQEQWLRSGVGGGAAWRVGAAWRAAVGTVGWRAGAAQRAGVSGGGAAGERSDSGVVGWRWDGGAAGWRWGQPAMLFLQANTIAAAAALFVKYEKERIST